MSRFDKYFGNIQNKESRFYRRLQDLDDLVYDRYFNEFSGKTSFIAEVLSETNQNTAAEGQGGNSTLYLPIRVRIDGIHTNQIPDPYKEVQALQGEEAAAKFRTLLLSHPLAFPDTEIYSDSAASQPLNRGDRIEVFFAEEGPQNYGRQRGLKYRKVVEPAIARTVPVGASIAEIFNEGTGQTVGDFSNFSSLEEILRPKENGGARSVDQIAEFIDNPEDLIEGVGYPKTSSEVSNEFNRWSGLVETNPNALPILTEYWDNIINIGENWYKEDWTPAGTPWSAAFISYILKDSDFRGSAGHLSYFKKNGLANNKWQLFSLIKQGQIKAQVGDILGYDGHSDIVYKIEGDTAHTAGGNLGDTAKEGRKVTLKNGNYIINEANGYVLLLKRI